MTTAMTDQKRIAILTGGGDVPGLNAVIKSVVYRATEVGYSVLGIRRGWEGLTHQRRTPELDPEYVRVLDRINTRTIDRTGGTIHIDPIGLSGKDDQGASVTVRTSSTYSRTSANVTSPGRPTAMPSAIVAIDSRRTGAPPARDGG